MDNEDGLKAKGVVDARPYCDYDPLLDSEKELLRSVVQEVTNFELLKDIRNELKDSKKDLEGRLYGYNPNFANLIASTEEFLHGKSSCLEPCQEEIDFYKMPVSLVYSETEIEYLKTKPTVDIIGGESPTQVIKAAMEESVRLFQKAVIHTACGARQLPSPREYKTKVIVVIEDNNEVLELLTVALWFFEKIPLATFQSKFCHSTPEFLLSVDACRVYFGSSPVYSTKEDGEHLFERWLGVGMNGILRSFQSKILLIDFPRPGMNLQKLKTILYDRLKIEKDHKIKSLYVGKSNRKEDNLSTVENVLDEIQRCLDPRDKLLFRKARRMYLDLKLYKNIEQKSRQDLKSSRDWGIPEPDIDNGHELFEGLHNSEVVVNNLTLPSMDISTIDTGLNLTVQDFEPKGVSSCDELSDANSIHSRKDNDDQFSELDDHNHDEENESSMMVDDDDGHEEVKHEDIPMTPSSSEYDMQNVVMSSLSSLHRKIVMHTESRPVSNPEVSGDDSERNVSPLEMDIYAGTEDGTDVLSSSRHLNDMVATNSSEKNCTETVVSDFSPRESSETLAERNVDFEHNACAISSNDEDKSEFSPHESVSKEISSKPEPRFFTTPIRRSANFSNLVVGRTMKDLALQRVAERDSSTDDLVLRRGAGVDSSNEDLMKDNIDSEKCTRLEFTLAPKETSDESSSGSHTSLIKNIVRNSVDTAITKRLNSGSSIEVASIKAEKIMDLKKSKSLHETCKAYLFKLSKSVSHMMRAPKSRRIFPERLIYTATSTNEAPPTRFIEKTKSTHGKGDGLSSSSSHTDSVVVEEDIIPMSAANRTIPENRNSRRWLPSLSRIFRIKKTKKLSKTSIEGKE